MVADMTDRASITLTWRDRAVDFVESSDVPITHDSRFERGSICIDGWFDGSLREVVFYAIINRDGNQIYGRETGTQQSALDSLGETLDNLAAYVP